MLRCLVTFLSEEYDVDQVSQHFTLQLEDYNIMLRVLSPFLVKITGEEIRSECNLREWRHCSVAVVEISSD